MKRALILLLGVLALGLGQVRAQVMPEYLEMNKGRFYDENGNRLTDGQMRSIIGDKIYEETYIGATKQFNAGKKLITFGAIGFGVGLVSAVTCAALYDSYEEDVYLGGVYLGSAIGILGALALNAGIPLKIFGKSRLYWIADDYNESKGYTLRVTGSSAGPGLGLALVF